MGLERQHLRLSPGAPAEPSCLQPRCPVPRLIGERRPLRSQRDVPCATRPRRRQPRQLHRQPLRQPIDVPAEGAQQAQGGRRTGGLEARTRLASDHDCAGESPGHAVARQHQPRPFDPMGMTKDDNCLAGAQRTGQPREIGLHLAHQIRKRWPRAFQESAPRAALLRKNYWRCTTSSQLILKRFAGPRIG